MKTKHEDDPGNREEHEGPEDPVRTQDRKVGAESGGHPRDDDPDDARNREEAVTADDAIEGMGEQARVPRTDGMRVPEKTGRDVAEKGNDCHDM